VRNENRAELFQENVRAWWTSVLVGQTDQPYPDRRLNIRASLDGDILVISGNVPEEDDLRAILAQVEPFVGREIAATRNEVTIVPEEQGDAGVLVQTLVGTFESEAQARLAATVLENRGNLQPSFIAILVPRTNGNSKREKKAVRQLVTDAYWKDICQALEKEQAVLVVTVDETSAFHAREILDEDTRSLQTVVLPPEPARTINHVREQNENATATSEVTDDGTKAAGTGR
jgi:hypothetical protein